MEFSQMKLTWFILYQALINPTVIKCDTGHILNEQLFEYIKKVFYMFQLHFN